MIHSLLALLTRRNHAHFIVFSLLGLALVCVLLPADVFGQVTKPVAISQLGVDVVSLKSGKAVRGAILKSEVKGAVTMAVPREWLQKANPELLTKLSTDEAALQREAWEQLRDRLKMLLATPPSSRQVVVFLEQEQERVEKLLAQAEPTEPPQFVWFEAQREAIAKVTPTVPDRQRVVLWAWSERLKEVTTRDVADLTRELKQKGIDTTQPAPDLSDQLAARPQDEREWGMRMALVEYAFGTPID